MFKTFHLVILSAIMVLMIFQGCSKSSSHNEENISLDTNYSNEINTTIPSDTNTSTTDEVDSQTKDEKDLFLSGTAIDGYIQGGKIQVINLDSNETFITQQKTQAQGKWSFRFTNNFKNIAIKIIGGIDESTKKPFEGIVSNIPDVEQFIAVPKGSFPTDKDLLKANKMIVTPLTTFMTNIALNKKISKKEAKKITKIS